MTEATPSEGTCMDCDNRFSVCTCDCSHCAGSGEQDEHDYDPINYGPGSWRACIACRGTGLAREQWIW